MDPSCETSRISWRSDLHHERGCHDDPRCGSGKKDSSRVDWEKNEQSKSNNGKGSVGLSIGATCGALVPRREVALWEECFVITCCTQALVLE